MMRSYSAGGRWHELPQFQTLQRCDCSRTRAHCGLVILSGAHVAAIVASVLTPLMARARVHRSWRGLRSDDSGAVLIPFALLSVTLFMFLGAGIDIARWLDARTKTLAAMDSAVLAAGRALQTNGGSQSDAIAVAQAYYKQAVQSRLSVVSDNVQFKIGSDNASIVATGSARIVTPFLNLAAIPSLPVINLNGAENPTAVLAVGANAKTSFEIAMMLDTSGSMGEGTKLADLKAAAKDLIDIVVWENQSQYYSKVALVPYATAVNVGSYATAVSGPYLPGTCSTPTCAVYRFTNAYGQRASNTIGPCVTERTGLAAYSDVAPIVAFVGKNYPSPSNPCLSGEIVPLTNDKNVLHTKIDALAAGGSTGGQVGVAWGWYLLSPNWGYLWPAASRPAAYATQDLRKIAVLMTDGEYNSGYCNGVISLDSGNGSGSPADHINCAAPNGDSYVQSQRLCAAMKAAGVTVYTIGFQVINSQKASDLLSSCASGSANYYNAADGNALKAAFRDIALKVSSLYLSH
jgi:Flp pilus assembly protein TadG